MTSTVPSRDWTDIRWADVTSADAARWIAVLPLAATEQHGPHLPLETDVMIGEAYLARVRELLPANLPATFLPIQKVGISTEHTDYPGTQTLPADVALKEWMALGEDVARRGLRKLVMVTSHGGNSAAMMLVAQDLRAKHRMLAVTTSWSRFGVPDGLFSGGRAAPRHSRRRGRNLDHAGAISARGAHAKRSRIFARRRLRWKRNSAGSRRSGRRRSPGRCRICIRAVRSATPPRAPRRRARSCSTMARARSANCSTTSITST